jgi:hypothetical protein
MLPYRVWIRRPPDMFHGENYQLIASFAFCDDAATFFYTLDTAYIVYAGNVLHHKMEGIVS